MRHRFESRMSAIGIVFLLLSWGVGASSTAHAAKYDIVFPTTAGSYVQSEFRDLSEQVGLAIAYLPLAPAEPLGLLGFDLGVEVTTAKIDADDPFWTKLVPEAPSYLPFPKLHLQKGLPFGIDVGVVYTKVPSSNIGMFGGELKWAILKGTLATPALALRGSYTALTGVDHLDVSTYGADVSVSKGVAFLTPYVGVGQVWIKSSSDAPGLSLRAESISATRGFVGLKLSLLVLSFAAEADFSKIPLYSLRASLSF